MKVYQIINKINGKIYIGKTVQTLKVRWLRHCGASSNCTKLKAAIKKYGKENFEIHALKNCSSLEELTQSEIEFIKELSPEYNCSKGGDGGDTRSGKKHTAETREKIRCAALGRAKRQLSDVHKEKLSKSMMGNKNHRLGKDFWKENGDKILASLRKNPPRAKAVLHVNTGVSYKSAREAASLLGLKEAAVSRVARGDRPHVGGHKFEYIQSSS